MLAVLFGTFVLVSIAEFGDKTQMLTLALAARYRLGPVLLGVGAAILLLQALAVIVGGVVARALPAGLVGWLAGGLFLVFGVWTLATAASGDGGEEDPATPRRAGPTLSAFGAFLLAELGDKTQLMTATIAADPGAALGPLRALGAPVAAADGGLGTTAAVWLGSVLGMFAVNALAAVAGSAIGSRIPRAVVGRVAGVVFILFGLATLAQVIGGVTR